MRAIAFIKFDIMFDYEKAKKKGTWKKSLRYCFEGPYLSILSRPEQPKLIIIKHY